MDLDDFKVVNDSLGHHTGDDLLVKVAERLGGCLRAGDTLARLGGDEFVMILEDTGLSGAVFAAQRVEKALTHPFFIGEEEHERFVTASIGITVSRNGATGAEDLLREADLAMYLAKDSGKARYGVFGAELGARAVARVRLEGELRRALKRGEFEVHYQPILGFPDRRIKGFEALVRWRHPERGMVPPCEFIGLMEETGLIIGLGKFVLEEACRDLARWQKEIPGTDSLFVCVNLSARQFLHPGLADEISGALELSGLDAASLYLEITENVAMSDDSGTGTLAGMRSLGVGLMIDDFGTGHSSLAYLKQLPVNCLKIDRSFSSGVGRERIDDEIVAAIVRLAHAVGLFVIAEGVETELQMTRLAELGCDHAQGFHVSSPVPAESVRELLRGGSTSGS